MKKRNEIIMKKIIPIFAFLALLSFADTIFANPWVNTTYQGEYVSINKVKLVHSSGYFYKVDIDFPQTNTPANIHYLVGKELGEGILTVYPNYEESLSLYLRQIVFSLNLKGVYLSDLIERVNHIKSRVPQEYIDEIEGIASNFSGVKDGSSDMLIQWWGSSEDKLTLNEFMIFNFIGSIAHPTGGSGISVYGDRSATGDTIFGCNFDYFEGLTGLSGYLGKISSTHAVYTYRNGNKSICSIGFLGLVGVKSGFNKQGLFVAALNSSTGGAYNNDSFIGKNDFLMDFRYALENFNDIDSLTNYLVDDEQSYTWNHIAFVSDKQTSKIVENNVSRPDGGSHRATRTTPEIAPYNSNLRDDVEWEFSDAICSVNSFLLDGSYDNHSTREDNLFRWNNYREQLEVKTNTVSGEEDVNTVSFQEIKDIISFIDNDDPEGDIYKGTQNDEPVAWGTVQGLVYNPVTQQLEVYFQPVPLNGGQSDTPTFEPIEIYFDNTINVSGTAYEYLGVSGKFVPDATISILELPHFTTTTDINGDFEFKNLPMGEQATFVLNKCGYTETATKTFILPKKDMKKLFIQAPLEWVYMLYAGVVGADFNKCHLVAAVTPENVVSVYAGGLACVRVKAERVDVENPFESEGTELGPSHGPIYLSQTETDLGLIPLPIKEMEYTDCDGGVLFFDVPPGVYRLTAEMDKACQQEDIYGCDGDESFDYYFEPIIMKCGDCRRVSNAAPISNLQGQRRVTVNWIDHPEYETTMAAGPRTGRYVKVSNDSPTHMCIAEVQVFDSEGNNIATYGTATQSSTNWPWAVGEYSFVADKAIDGNTGGDYLEDGFGAMTDWATENGNNWWIVDLGYNASISSINIYNRTDAYNASLNGATVEIIPEVKVKWVNHPVYETTLAEGPTTGRYVKISIDSPTYMCLAEVQVFDSEGNNLALNGIATQSSTHIRDELFGPYKAIDDTTSGHIQDWSVTMTDWATENDNNWWMVDLGYNASIAEINVYNRTDAYSESLNGATVEIISD
jgi:hypothetical protein